MAGGVTALVPVVHYFGGLHGRDDRTLPNVRLPRNSPDWTRWMYLTDPASARLWFDPGVTRRFQEHVNATLAFNASRCPSREPTQCRWLYPDIAALARAAGLDSLQFTRHTMDRYRPVPRYELVDLRRPWRPWRDGAALSHPYYASADRAPCAALLLNRTSLRAECRQPFEKI